MNVPAVILWNLAPCSRPSKCHQLGQQRAYLGLSFLIEETSLLSHKMYPKHKQWELEVNTERWKEHSGNKSCTSWGATNAVISNLARSPKQGWGHWWLHVPTSGHSALTTQPHKKAAKDKPCKHNGEVSQLAQQYLVISKSASQTQTLLPQHKPQQRSIEDSEKAPAGVSLVQGNSSTCFTMTAETLQHYNCVSITSGGNGNLGVIAS